MTLAIYWGQNLQDRLREVDMQLELGKLSRFMRMCYVCVMHMVDSSGCAKSCWLT